MELSPLFAAGNGAIKALGSLCGIAAGIVLAIFLYKAVTDPNTMQQINSLFTSPPKAIPKKKKKKRTKSEPESDDDDNDDDLPPKKRSIRDDAR